VTIVPETAPTRVAISGTQWHSVAISSNPWQSLAISGARGVSARAAAREVSRRELEQGRAAVHH
jgi:hypothetical protein